MKLNVKLNQNKKFSKKQFTKLQLQYNMIIYLKIKTSFINLVKAGQVSLKSSLFRNKHFKIYKNNSFLKIDKLSILNSLQKHFL